MPGVNNPEAPVLNWSQSEPVGRRYLAQRAKSGRCADIPLDHRTDRLWDGLVGVNELCFRSGCFAVADNYGLERFDRDGLAMRKGRTESPRDEGGETGVVQVVVGRSINGGRRDTPVGTDVEEYIHLLGPRDRSRNLDGGLLDDLGGLVKLGEKPGTG